MKLLILWFGLLFWLSLQTSLVLAERRVALVIGNANYPLASPTNLFGPLDNPLNDARGIRTTLEKYRFEVIPSQDNLNKQQMNNAVSTFISQLEKSQVGLFYYSGHATQVNNINYLIPVGKDFDNAIDVKYHAINAREILEEMENTGSKINIVILDACRDYMPALGRGLGKHGLAEMTAKGVIMSYATAPGKTASDGKGSYGTYTQHLLEAMKIGNLTIEQVFKNTRQAVAQATDYDQIPWTSSSLIGDFCFENCGKTQLSVKSQPTSTDWVVPGKVFQDRLKDDGLAPEMVVIPAGRFRMGDIQGGGDKDEQPVHEVSMKSFAIGRYEVTFAEYDQFAQATGRKRPKDWGWGRGKRPVINVSWHDAVAYAQWLSQQTGKWYRLPTEAEWEYAARAGTETKYWWGNEIGHNRANCNGCGSQWDRKMTAPVGSFTSNPFGLYDTAGNVWEWTCSEYIDSYQGQEQNCANLNDGSLRKVVIRGGCWGFNPRGIGAANRYRDGVSFRGNALGFRLVRM